MDNVSAVAIVDVCTYVVDSVIGVDADDVASIVDVDNEIGGASCREGG